MTNATNKTDAMIASRPMHPTSPIGPSLLSPHGGYRSLKSYQAAEIIYDLTVEFCRRYVDHLSSSSYESYRSFSRMSDQMIQAARSGKQNIAEGSQDSGTSKKTELKLTNIARGSLEELLTDYLDFLRQHQLPLWNRDDPRTGGIRAIAYHPNRSHSSYQSYMSQPESAANCLVCLIHQCNYLLDRQLSRLGTDFLEHGGFTERIYHARAQRRSGR